MLSDDIEPEIVRLNCGKLISVNKGEWKERSQWNELITPVIYGQHYMLELLLVSKSLGVLSPITIQVSKEKHTILMVL